VGKLISLLGNTDIYIPGFGNTGGMLKHMTHRGIMYLVNREGRSRTVQHALATIALLTILANIFVAAEMLSLMIELQR